MLFYFITQSGLVLRRVVDNIVEAQMLSQLHIMGKWVEMANGDDGGGDSRGPVGKLLYDYFPECLKPSSR